MPSDSAETSPRAFLVGDLLVDVGQQRVIRAGGDIAVSNLSFRLFVALIRAAPNVLSYESLMTQVWPNLVVSLETVNKRVNLLREVIGDDSREPRYIAGVRGRGYRLIAPVSDAAGTSSLLNLPSYVADTVPRSAEMPIPTAPTELPQTVVPKSPVQSARWVVLAFLATGLLIPAVIGVRWAARHRVDGAIPAPVARETTTAASEALSRTVAVLPFDSISADPADAYLAQGLPEMILNRLSRVSGLTVIARNSSFALTSKNIDSREIGRRLNSGYLIGGSVQREADRLRVAVHLVDCAAGTLIWSAHFDRGLHDIFSIEDEIADQLAGAMSVRLGEVESKPSPGVRSANLEAYLAFLQGRTLLGRFSVTESEAAVPFFERAIALDPGFASAFASLYDARMQVADQRREDLTLTRKRYRHLIDRALELDPKSGSAYFARAMWGEEPHDASATADNPLMVGLERDFRQGAALDPSNGRGLKAYAEFLYNSMYRSDEGKSVLKRALWVDPMSPSARFTDAMFTLDDGGAKASEQKILQVLELDPNFVPALQQYGTFRWLIDGKLAEALQVVEHAVTLDPNNYELRHAAVWMYLDFGDLKAAHDVAAGTPHSERTTALFLLHEGDWRGAGLAAYNEAGWTNDDDYCQNWLAAEAIGDYALKTGELSRAIGFIRLKYYFGAAPAAHLDYCNYRAALSLSQLLDAAGQGDQALALRRAVSSWAAANATRFLGDARRVRARVLLLDGKPDAALAELAESFRSGEYAIWWYTLWFDPVWLSLHNDPRFQAIEADVRRHLDAQHSELDGLRQNGLIPRRGLQTASR